MDIFYVNIDRKVLETYKKPELKKLQSKLGRHIVDFVAKNVYKIQNPEIVVENNKPKFRYSDIKFSISHSKGVVLVAFDKFLLGADIEYMKDRDYEKFNGHYGIEANDKPDFYRQWTLLEAKIKLQSERVGYVYADKLENDYMLTVVSISKNPFVPNIRLLNYDSVLKLY